jgi:hypothetical protein
MGGFVESVFGGGGDSGGGGSNSATTSNKVTVNPTTNVMFDTAPLADALTQSAQLNANAQAATASVNATAMVAVAKAMTKATEDTVAAFNAHLDAENKNSLILAIVSAAALAFLPKYLKR